MSVPMLQLKLISVDCDAGANDFGETSLAYAPTIRLANGQQAVPQQYLDVERTLDNLENVLACIDTPDGYQLFAGQDGACLFIVVGLFGRENYPQTVDAVKQTKIVYGRRWLIEETTPTSEIVQTAMLAIKKAREHEVRELMTLTTNVEKRRTTPFNCHLDLPLMAGNSSEFHYPQASSSVDQLLQQVRVDGCPLKVVSSQMVGAKLIVEVSLDDAQMSENFPELRQANLTVVCEQGDGRDFLHQLCNALIHASDRFIEEQVGFNGFKRFSHNLCPEKLANFSYQTRNVALTDARFDTAFSDMSYRVDAAKAPIYNAGRLGKRQRAAVNQYSELAGYHPREST